MNPEKRAHVASLEAGRLLMLAVFADLARPDPEPAPTARSVRHEPSPGPVRTYAAWIER